LLGRAEMTITCPKCKTKLKLSEEKTRPEGTRIKCAKCGAVLVYRGKARKELPEREEKPATFPEAAETEDLSGREEQSPDVSLPPSAPEGVAPGGPPVPEQATGGPPAENESLVRLRETITSYSTDTGSLPAGGEGKKGIPGRAVMAGSAAGVFILLLLAIFFFRSPETGPQKQQAPAPPAEEASQPAAPVPSQESSPIVSPEALPPAAVPPEEMSSSTPEEKAIAIVKRSDVLLKMTSVEAIVDKWAQDNAGRYKVVGWQAKQIDEQRYLVSYTALEGNAPKGFYFVADLQNGTVEDLAHNPELQKKYNIQYAR
jgi:predicted Zn finger-like uncharacterized protein